MHGARVRQKQFDRPRPAGRNAGAGASSAAGGGVSAGPRAGTEAGQRVLPALPGSGVAGQEEPWPAEESTSTITLVDFTTAVAGTPGASSISSAASRLIRETIR
jgi:hypothetical protein